MFLFSDLTTSSIYYCDTRAPQQFSFTVAFLGIRNQGSQKVEGLGLFDLRFLSLIC